MLLIQNTHNIRAPFTLQRLCELLNEPTKYYRKLERVLLSIEKCLNVRTTLPIESATQPKEVPEVADTPMTENPTETTTQPSVTQQYIYLTIIGEQYRNDRIKFMSLLHHHKVRTPFALHLHLLRATFATPWKHEPSCS